MTALLLYYNGGKKSSENSKNPIFVEMTKNMAKNG